jgi:hypothetical protein
LEKIMAKQVTTATVAPATVAPATVAPATVAPATGEFIPSLQCGEWADGKFSFLTFRDGKPLMARNPRYVDRHLADCRTIAAGRLAYGDTFARIMAALCGMLGGGKYTIMAWSKDKQSSTIELPPMVDASHHVTFLAAIVARLQANPGTTVEIVSDAAAVELWIERETIITDAAGKVGALKNTK